MSPRLYASDEPIQGTESGCPCSISNQGDTGGVIGGWRVVAGGSGLGMLQDHPVRFRPNVKRRSVG